MFRPYLKNKAVVLNQQNGNSGQIDKSEKRSISLSYLVAIL